MESRGNHLKTHKVGSNDPKMIVDSEFHVWWCIPENEKCAVCKELLCLVIVNFHFNFHPGHKTIWKWNSSPKNKRNMVLGYFRLRRIIPAHLKTKPAKTDEEARSKVISLYRTSLRQVQYHLFMVPASNRLFRHLKYNQFTH
jgi:hypothetical protein